MSLFQCRVGKWILPFRVKGWIHVAVQDQTYARCGSQEGANPKLHHDIQPTNDLVAQPTRSHIRQDLALQSFELLGLRRRFSCCYCCSLEVAAMPCPASQVHVGHNHTCILIDPSCNCCASNGPLAAFVAKEDENLQIELLHICLHLGQK